MKFAGMIVGVVGAMACVAGGVESDPYADATVWLKGYADADGDGCVDAAELRSAQSNAVPWTSATLYNSPTLTNSWIRMPYRGGKIYAPSLGFPQTVTVTNAEKQLGYAKISTIGFGNFTAAAGVTGENYTCAIRFRPANEQFHPTYCWIFNWGYGNEACGFNLGLTQGGWETITLVSGTVTNKVTVRKFTPNFFKTGHTANLFSNAGDTVYGELWHDLIIAVDGEHGKVRYVLARAAFDPDEKPWTKQLVSDRGGQFVYSNEVAMSETYNNKGTVNPVVYKPAAWMTFGAEATSSASFACQSNKYTCADNNAMKCFRGSIHQFATWNRALGFEEMKRALAAPRGDLVRMGVQDGTAREFRGGTAVDADAPEWTLPASFAKDTPVTVTFRADRKGEGELAQVFRWFGASDSGTGEIRLAVNGTAVGTAGVGPNRKTTWLVKGGLVKDGTNTLTLTRTDAGSGGVKLDAAALGGSWQIGHKDAAFNDFAHESHGLLRHEVLDGNWYSIRRVLFGGTTGGNVASNMIYTFTTPPDFRSPHYGWKLIWKDGTGDARHFPRWALNGHDLGYTAAADKELHALDIPDAYFAAGDGRNELLLHNVGTYVAGAYYHVDYIRLEVQVRNGTILILR